MTTVRLVQAIGMRSLFLAAGLIPAALQAQQLNLPALADSVFQPWASTHAPGCAVGIGRGGQVLLTRGYGMADLERGAPITAETIFESGSVAKQFTATAVLLLARDGRLTLDDPVRRYIPELPEYGRPLTIRHLLTHTSGLREWSSLVAMAGWPRGRRAHEQSDLLDVVFRQQALNYPVGDYYSYTNSGYALAMTLVERVSGVPFPRFSRERIFAPLGMTHTQWRDDFTRLVPGRAEAYTRDGGEWRLAMPFEDVIGPGGLLTTVGDWLIWNQALAGDRLGGGIADSLTRPMRLTDGRAIRYGLGLFVTEYRGVRELSHSGSTAGYSTFLVRYPDRGELSLAILCNASTANPGAYAHRLADRLISDFPPAALDTVPVDSGAFARYAGLYRNQRTQASLQVGADAGPRFRKLPDGSFWLGNGTRWLFEAGAAGQPARSGAPTALRVVQPDGDTVPYAYAAGTVWSPAPAELQAFAGTYRSAELGVTYDAKVASDTLTLSTRAGVVRRLRPTYPDGFAMGGTAVWFSRDRRGRVTAMHFSESRVWDLVLARLR